MNQLRDKVAVITGAASGFGRELAIACAHEGMRLALSDIDETNLRQTVALLPAGTQVLAQECDVAKAEQLDQLADETRARFGAAHLLFQAGRLSAADIARITIEAVKEDRFYILPHPKIKAAIEIRMRDILDDRSPTRTTP